MKTQMIECSVSVKLKHQLKRDNNGQGVSRIEYFNCIIFFD